jgi:hypothetical protein
MHTDHSFKEVAVRNLLGCRTILTHLDDLVVYVLDLLLAPFRNIRQDQIDVLVLKRLPSGYDDRSVD